MTKETIRELRWVAEWAQHHLDKSKIINDGADAIEALQARVADQSAQLTRHTNLIDQLQEERCKLAAELAAARAQEPVSHRYRFIHPISGEPVWRDSSSTWNGQCVQEVQQLFAAPIPPVREPLSDNAIAALRQAIAQPATTEWTVIAPDGTRFTGPTPLKAALPASKYRLEIDPVAAVKFIETITKASCALGYEECGHRCGTPHICCDHYVEPEPITTPIPPVQEPAGSIRLWDAQWISIVNHDNAYNGWSTNDAVNHAVRMTERYIAANVAQNNLPPRQCGKKVDLT